MAHNSNDIPFSDDESEDFNSKTLKFLRSGGRSTSNQLLMEAVETSEEEQVPLPDYERLSQSMRSPEDPDPRVISRKTTKTEYPPPQVQVQIPFARKLMDKMFKKEKGEKDNGDGESVTSSEDGAGEEEKKEKKKKKRSSWLPDPERRWPQGF